MTYRARVWLLVIGFGALLSWWLALERPETQPEPALLDPRPSAAKSEPVFTQSGADLRAVAPAPRAALALPPTAAERQAPAQPDGPLPPGTLGFIEDLTQLYERAPRDSGASAYEQAVRDVFRNPRVPAGLLRSVLCRERICKLELEWSPEREAGYQHALEQLMGGNAKFVATRAGRPDARGLVPVDAYWLRMRGLDGLER